MDVQISLSTVFWLVSGVSGCIALYVLIKKNLPTTKLQAEFNAFKEDVNEKLKRDNERIKDLESMAKQSEKEYLELMNNIAETNKVIIKALSATLDDDVEAKKKAKAELHEFLIKSV